jgi:ADP-ribosylglycohydrolase
LAGFAQFEGYPTGQYTDDTQLSVATVQSILKCGGIVPADVARAIAALWKTGAVVGPGGACTYAANQFLKERDWTTCGAPAGQAGNGTAMRTAVLGLACCRNPAQLPATVAEISRLTHHDLRSVAGGVAVAKAAQLLAADASLDRSAFCAQVALAMEPYEPSFAGRVRDLPALVDGSPATAVAKLAWSGMDRPEFDQPIITPFVIPTVLAAFWCLLRYPDSWPRAVASAIRLGGDVDTLGAIVGALAGTRLGLSAIPAHLVATVLHGEHLKALGVRYWAWAMLTR